MFLQISFKIFKIPLCVLAIGFLLFCLPKLAYSHNEKNHFDFSQLDQGRFRLFIAVPKGEPPLGGWPFIILLDGNKTLPIAASYNPDAVLVGIGYPTEDNTEIVAKRYFDLTSKAPDDKIPGRSDRPKPKTGGEAQFRKYIFDDMLPFVAKNYAINIKKLSLYGHSLGGYFVIKTLLSSDAEKVQNYCAADPSIWWNDHELWHELRNFNINMVGQARLLIDVAEKKVAHRQLSLEDQKRVNALRQGPTGKEVSELLRTQKSFANVIHSFAHESHGTLITPSIADCLSFALGIKFNPKAQ